MASLLEDVLATNAASPEILDTLKDPRAYTAIIVDEPARYFYEESDKENWDQRTDFQNVVPPFETTWMEFRAPKYIRSEVYGVLPWHHHAWQRAGVLLTLYEDHPVKSEFDNARWVVEAELFIDNDESVRNILAMSMHEGALRIIQRTFGTVNEDLAEREAAASVQREMAKVPKIMNFLKFTYGIEADGRIALTRGGQAAFRIEQSGSSADWFNITPDGRRLLSDGMIPIMNTVLLATYMMHAAGTELKNKQVPPKVKKAREKKRKVSLPDVRFKVLDLGLGMRQSLKDAKAEGLGLSRALHLRRGHFKTFTKPMFGRKQGKTGPVWVRPHRVGDKEQGEVIKQYRIKRPPQEPPASRYNPESLIQRTMQDAYRGRRTGRQAYSEPAGESAPAMDRIELLARLMDAYRAAEGDAEGQEIIMNRIKKLGGYRDNPEGYCRCDEC